MFEQIFMILVLVIFNLTTAVIFNAIRKLDLKGVLREKNPSQALINASSGTDSTEIPSYSRLAGTIGTVVMATFLWALANILIYKAFSAPAEIATILDSVGNFFLAGSALFAPYAFNQLRSVFS